MPLSTSSSSNRKSKPFLPNSGEKELKIGLKQKKNFSPLNICKFISELNYSHMTQWHYQTQHHNSGQNQAKGLLLCFISKSKLTPSLCLHSTGLASFLHRARWKNRASQTIPEVKTEHAGSNHGQKLTNSIEELLTPTATVLQVISPMRISSSRRCSLSSHLSLSLHLISKD